MKKNKQIYVVLLSGKKQVGKDTAANILIKENGYVKVAFADLLKEASATVLNVLFRTKIKKSYFENEEFKQETLPGYNITHRQFLQYFGTEFVRNYIHNNFWVTAAINTIADLVQTKKQTKFVITDVRFEQEIMTFKHDLKEIFPDAIITTVRIQRTPQTFWKKIKDQITEHVSETGLDFYPDWDYYLYNYFDLESYKKSVRSFIAFADGDYNA